ncbi:hypothetical protein [Mycolicibacter kumamotonensis]|nr:hypothetical protein [Mycolicibacter kumamotonensis]
MQQFTRDMWEASREQLRAELASSLSAEDFEQRFPSWEDLPRESKLTKMRNAQESLKLMDRAGYTVIKK